MELKCIKPYATSGFEMRPGDTTEGLDIPEGKKKQMLADFPERFEVVGETSKEDGAETKVPVIETKEDGETVAKKAARAKK